MKSKLLAIAIAAALSPAAGATPLVTTGTYDENDVQLNAVNFSMGYSGNTTWTTGIGQTLGASQIRTVAELKPLIEDAFLTGNGGVISFDGVVNADYNNMQSFDVSFAGGAKQMTLNNRIDGSYSIAGPLGDRTAISGSQFLSTGGNPHFDLGFTGFTGFGPDEKITAVGVTILGRNGQGTGRNFRVIARYTNGEETGSSSTFRSFDMQNGNTSQDSFSGIVAPDGYWITSIRVHSDNGIFTGIDDLAFITSDVVPDPPEIAVGLEAEYNPYLGDFLELSVTLAGGTPPLEYQWFFNDDPIDEFLGGNDPVLLVLGSPEEDGEYKLVVSNSAGSDESVTQVSHTGDAVLADWFRQYRLRVKDTRDGGNTVQISEFVLSLDGAPLGGGSASNPGGNNPGTEGPANAIDGDTATKWLDFNKQPLVVSFATRRVIDAYDFATANDAPGRDPVSWVIEGSNDGSSWTRLHTVFDNPTPTDRFTYAGGFSIPADRNDTDEDGLPDDWEFLHFGNLRQGPDDDFDGDGATNLEEFQTAQGILIQRDAEGNITGLVPFSGSSDPNDPDSQPDSDGNGLPDPWEMFWFGALGQDPAADLDDDGLTNQQELIAGTDPTNPDTSGDGISDGDAVAAGLNPLWPSFLREWRPGGLANGTGLWNNSVPNWYDGHSAVPAFEVWSADKRARFAGSLGANTEVTVAAPITGIRGIDFTHTGSGDWLLTGSSLSFSDPVIRAAGRIGRIDSQVMAMTGLDIFSDAGGGLALGGDNTGSLAGLITVHPGAAFDPVGGNAALAGADVVVSDGAQLRLFASGLVFFESQQFTVGGFGHPHGTTGAGAIRGGGGAWTREFDLPLLLSGDTGIRLEGGQALLALDGVGRAAGVDEADLVLALDGGAVFDVAATVDLGDGGLVVGPLPGPGGGSAGGTVVLGGTDNEFVSLAVAQGLVRIDSAGALPVDLPVFLTGGTVELNTFAAFDLSLITGSGGAFNVGPADVLVPMISGTGGSVSIGSGTLTLDLGEDVSTGRMIRTTNTPGSLFVKQGSGKLRLTGTDNRGGGANGNWIIEEGTLELAADQPQFGTIREGGTVTVKDGATVLVSNSNALSGWSNGGTHYVLEAGATLQTADDIPTHATRITLRGGTMQSGAPSLEWGSFSLQGNSAERRIIADGGAVTSVISADDIRLATPAGYIFETIAGTAPSGIDLDVTGSLNGPHGMIKEGEGVMRLGGSAGHGFEGATVVQAGTLRLDAAVPQSPLFQVAAGAVLDLGTGFTFGPAQTLAGSGTVTGPATVQGTLAPGASTGTLATDDLTLAAGAVFAVEIDDLATPANDSVAVSGKLDLGGATLAIEIQGEPGAAVYVIATYNELDGTFGLVTGMPDGYSIDYDHAGGTAIALVSGAPADNFDTWAAANGIAGQPFDGDFDGDGIPNGMEYALAGLDPTVPGGFPGTFENGTLSFSKRPEAVANGDVTWTIETSETLEEGSWTTVTPDIDDNETIAYTLPPEEERIFARLRVAPAEP